MDYGLCAVAAVAIIAAYKTENGARCLTFIILAFFSILATTA